MRLYIEENSVRVVLSERNLKAGLHKLRMPGSARELTSLDSHPSGILLRLQFETDEEHYTHEDRLAPPVPGVTELDLVFQGTDIDPNKS